MQTTTTSKKPSVTTGWLFAFVRLHFCEPLAKRKWLVEQIPKVPVPIISVRHERFGISELSCLFYKMRIVKFAENSKSGFVLTVF